MDSTRWIKIKELFMTAFDLPENERAAFLETCEPDLRPEVERLLRADIDAGGFINEPAVVDLGLAQEPASDPYIGQQIDSYKIVEEIGHGGMGTVYLAHRADASFDKQVALKLIKRGMDTNAVLKRFVMERRILAQLQHRFIANLLDGGSTGDGLPYFVMEHVEGLPITKFCDSHGLSIDERLELFRKVCSAVSYAHQNLIIHRDIKPSNIMVTEDGVPKLLDFGIAKLLNPDWSLYTNEATATMFRVLTPEYASPEQMRGAPITTTSDVYSLGVVLYELLCGQRPFKLEGRMPDEAAQIVLTEEPIRPSSVVSSESKAQGSQKSNVLTDENNEPPTRNIEQPANPKSNIQNLKSLRGDLDNIILKALAIEPERRYQSVQEFSEDIRRHVAGLPVTATADSLAYRMAKFVKRHRTAVVAGGAVLLILLAATAVTSWQASVARRERDRADQRFNQVRKLAHTVLFDYHDGIAELAGSTPIREKMVKDTIEYLDNLANETGGDAELQRELASAYQKVGDVQGNPFTANLGNPDGSLESYKKGVAILEALPASEANRPQSRASLGQGYEKIGDILWARGESADSQASYRRALSIYENLKTNGELSDGSSLNRVYNRIGQTQEQVGDLISASQSYQLSLEESQTLAAAEPNNTKYRRAVAIAYAKIGDVSYQAHDYKVAATNFQNAFSILRDLSDKEPTNTTLRRTLGLIDARLALTEMKAGNYVDAVEFNRQTIEIQRQIVGADPNNLQIQFDLAATLGNLGECYGLMHLFAQADKSFQEAMEISRHALSKDPTYSQGREHFANNYLMYAQMLQKSGDAPRALEQYKNAQEIFEVEPLKSKSSDQLAEMYEGIGDALLALNKNGKNFTDARIMYQLSLDTLTNLQQSGKLNSENIGKLTEIPQKIAKCETALAKVQRQ